MKKGDWIRITPLDGLDGVDADDIIVPGMVGRIVRTCPWRKGPVRYRRVRFPVPSKDPTAYNHKTYWINERRMTVIPNPVRNDDDDDREPLTWQDIATENDEVIADALEERAQRTDRHGPPW